MKLKIKAIVDGLVYILFLGFVRLVRSLPAATARRLGMGLGILAYWLDFRHYSVAMINLRRVFSHRMEGPQIRAMCREVFTNLGIVLVDFIRSISLTSQNINDHFTFEGEENLLKARAKGKGILILSAHLGNWELLAAHCLKFGQGNEYVVTKRIHNPYLDRFINNLRRSMGVEILPHRGSARDLVKKLKEGAMVGFVLDQSASEKEAVWVDFFGEKVPTYKSLALLAMNLGTPVLPTFAIRDGDGRYRMVYKEEVELVSTGNSKEDVVANTARFNRIIEDMILSCPEQWFWVHNRWKHAR